MSADRPIPVILHDTAGQHFDCHGCTNCCREPVVHLLESDRQRLDARPWAEVLGIQPYVRLGDAWLLNKRPDGRCAFLEDDGKCRLHREFGRSEKPLACQMFPFNIVRSEKAWRMGWRFDCPSVARSLGRPIHKHENDVRKLAHRLASEAASPERNRQAEPPAGSSSEGGIVRAVEDLLARGDIAVARRIRLLATFAGLIADPLFGSVDEASLCRFVASVGGALGEVEDRPVSAPTGRQRAFLRVAIFAHCEQVSLEAARSAWRRVALRFGQLSKARRFRKGRGSVPSLAAGAMAVSFDDVEAMPVGLEEARAIEELLLRYLKSAIGAHAFYGPAYYGWSPIEGLAALCLRLPMIGWLARYLAAVSHRAAVSHADVVTAVGRIDQSAGRVAALGTRVEALRLQYLLRDQGLLRLTQAYHLHGSDSSRA